MVEPGKYGVLSCPDCGSVVPKTSPNMKRCKPCALRAHGQTGHGLRPRTCEACGSTYQPTSGRQRYCPDCGPQVARQRNIEYLRARRLRHIGDLMTCERCGMVFPRPSSNRRLCSDCRKAKDREWIKGWLRKHPDAPKRYYVKQHDNYRFSGNWLRAMQRDGFRCQRCGATTNLTVHHIDGRGWPLPKHERNDSLDNLVTLCNSCHTFVHKTRDSQWYKPA